MTKKKRRGLVLVTTGKGKGKSSSAFGMVFRSAGWGLQVLVIQYIKGKWRTGEERAAEKFDNIEWHAMGDGFTWDTENPEQDLATSRKIWEFSKEKIVSGKYDLVILDELNYCCGYGWISGEEIADFIQNEKPEETHLVMTGRDAAEEVIAVADTVTVMEPEKHAFEKGIKAAKGIEF